MKLNVKLPLIAIVMGTVILAVFVATKIVTDQQKFDGMVINLAGRQRMLSQKIAKELYLCRTLKAQGLEVEKTQRMLENSIKVFDLTLTALRDGGQAPVTTNLATTAYQICPRPGAAERELLAIASQTWNSFGSSITTLTESSFGASNVWNTIEEKNSAVLVASEKVVQQLQKNSENRIRLLMMLQLAGLIIGMLGVVWTIMVVRALLHKLNQANSLTIDFSKGDLTRRVLVKHIVDELDTTLDCVNRLGENIAGIVSQIYAANNTLVGVSGNFSKTFAAIAGNARTVRDRNTSVAEAAEKASANVQSISAATEEMSATVTSVATAMEQMSASIKEVAKNCQQESQIAQEANQQVQSTGAIIQQMGISAKEIGRIIDMISGIADRTNLLALNATIEAASAGGAGKGFAVVANEVKALAKQSAEAALSIREKIETMQRDTGASISSIGVIAEVIQNVSVISHTIAATVEEQSVTANEIARNLGEASVVANQISRHVADVATGITGVSKTIQTVNSDMAAVTGSIDTALPQVQSLTGMGTQLASVVSTFKIKAALIEWSDEYSVAVTEMDNQHKRLIAMINDLNTAATEGQSKQAVAATLQRLIDYTTEHFTKEEQFLVSIKYPDYEKHTPVHRAFVEKVLAFKADFESGRAMVSTDIMLFLKDWLVKHIMGTDKQYGVFASRRR